MGDIRCCCGGSCTVYQDDFDGSGTPSTSNWTVHSGTWTEGAGVVVESGTSGACMLTTAVSQSREQYVTAITDQMDDGDIVRVTANAKGANDYFFAEVEQDVVGDTYTVRLYKKENGGDTLLSEDVLSPALDVAELTPLGIGICLSNTSFSVVVENQDVTSVTQVHYACHSGLIPGGLKAGLGNGGSNEIQFTDFSFGDFRGDTGSNEGCRGADLCCIQQCLCCETWPGVAYCIPKTITVTIHAANGCDNSPYNTLNNETVDLEYNPGGGYWEGNNTPACLVGTKWRFACEGENYVLTLMDVGGTTSHVNDCITYDDLVAESISCDPAIITFPTQQYSWFEGMDCDCCDPYMDGEFYADVTW